MLTHIFAYLLSLIVAYIVLYSVIFNWATNRYMDTLEEKINPIIQDLTDVSLKEITQSTGLKTKMYLQLQEQNIRHQAMILEDAINYKYPEI